MPNEWQSVLDEIKNNVSEMAYEAYFARFDFVSNEDGVLITSVPNIFTKTQIEGKFNSAVIDALKSSGIKYKEFKVIIDGKENKTTVKRAVETGAIHLSRYTSYLSMLEDETEDKYRKEN